MCAGTATHLPNSWTSTVCCCKGLITGFLLQAFLVYPDVQIAAARSEEGQLMAFSAASAQVDAASAMLPRLIPFAEHWELLLSQGGHLPTAPGMRCMPCLA